MNSGTQGGFKVGTLFTRDGRTAQQIQSADILLSGAQILALYTTPITLVAAPAAGKALVFEGAVLFYDFGTAAYTVGTASSLSVKYTGAAGLALGGTSPTGFLDQATNQLRYVRPYTAASAESGLTPVTAPLVLHQLTANMTAGDGTLAARVFYRVVPTTLLQ